MGMDIYTRIGFGIGLNTLPSKCTSEDGGGFEDWLWEKANKELGADADYAARSAWLKAFPVTIERLCYDDADLHMLVFRASVISGNYTEAKEIDASHFTQAFDIDALKKFCADYDVPYEEPKWILGAEFSN